jgi:hypothetical protein
VFSLSFKVKDRARNMYCTPVPPVYLWNIGLPSGFSTNKAVNTKRYK